MPRSKNEWSCTSTSPIRLHCVVLSHNVGTNLPFTKTIKVAFLRNRNRTRCLKINMRCLWFKPCDSAWLIVLILHWTLSIVWCIFSTCDASGVDSVPRNTSRTMGNKQHNISTMTYMCPSVIFKNITVVL